jgi:ABC-2 type transport system ATP-binding protein
MPPVLEFENVSKQYRGGFRRAPVRALDGFTLTVEAGEIFGFLGPNGSGKTTAIHIAMGFTSPTSGSGQMLGRSFGDAPTRRRVGFLGENVALYHRPVSKLVRFYGALNGIRDPQLRRRTQDVLQAMDLADAAPRNAGKLSRGMQQRVGLAQALVNDPELLILDEPTSALDPLGRVAVRELLQRAQAAGKTVFLSSHMLSEIELICDRVALLHRGRVARSGKTADLISDSGHFEIVIRGLSQQDLHTLSDSVDSLNDAGAVFRIRVPASRQRFVIERVWTLGGEIVSVTPARRSLESIFVELATMPTSSPDSREGGGA